jgi:creatinine amidohydrolase/Fe(II)-dependent formamide hydrolase-like protein
MTDIISFAELDRRIEEGRSRNRKALAFLPIGCTEQHGPFLPIQTDTIVAEHFSKALSAGMEDEYVGQVFPAVSYSPTKSNIRYTGTVSVDEDILRRYVRQICEGLLDSRFDALVLVSAHGPADPSLNEICFNLVHEQYRKENPVIKPVLPVSLSECRAVMEKKFGQKPGKHADWVELLFLVHILGNGYFDQGRIREIILFQQQHSFASDKVPLLGTPVELRSVQGVIGEPAPLSGHDWHDLARTAWEENILHTATQLKQKLKGFWKEDQFLC